MPNSQNPTMPTAPSGVLPNSNLLRRIEGRWILQILVCLNRGEHRFSDLRDAIPPISASVLTERIRGLERAGLVERRYLPPPSASQVYRLTASAAGLRPALDVLASWHAETLGMSPWHITL
jgi:DNA-binding HxlR family transcriptional regulator